MAVTSHDVARLAGVSQPTVSRALREDPRIAAGTRARVQQAAAALGYVPSEAARSLATRVNKRVALVITDLTNPFYPYLVGPVHDELERYGYRMTLLVERSDSAIATERLIDDSIDGLVLGTATLSSRLPEELHRRNVPFVFLNRAGDQIASDAVVVDNRAGGDLAAQELARLGHRRVAAILGPEDTSTGRDREAGFRAGLAEAGLELAPGWLKRGPFEEATGDRCASELLAQPDRPTGVFCGNDVIAIGVINAVRRAGLTIPEDITVIGFDNLPLASWKVFDLTTVAYDLDGMARTAVRLLVDRLVDRQKAAQRVEFPVTLVRRSSSGPPPGGGA